MKPHVPSIRYSAWALAVMALVCVGGRSASASSLVVTDFDGPAAETFVFKDEKGSSFNASTAYADPVRHKHLGLRYRLVEGGFGGWGLVLKGLDVQKFRYLGLDVRGEAGGESFSIGLRDAKGKEVKRSVTQFSDITPEWRTVLIPLKEFSEVDLGSLDNMSLSLVGPASGRVFIDNVHFEGSAGTSTEGPSATLTSKVLVDGFERLNPVEDYQVFTGDESSLTLSASRWTTDGDYSMELEYRFATDRPWGSWVSAVRRLRDPMDWTGVADVKIWVKGDGSDSVFRFRVTLSDGGTWEYTDASVLRFTRWTLVTMPLSSFRSVSRAAEKLDPTSILSYEIGLMSPTSQGTTGAKTASGRIQVDQLYVVGQRLKASQAAPITPPRAGRGAGNLDFSLNAYTEFMNNPEEKSTVNHYAKLITSGKLGNFSARAEFGSASQEFGRAAAFVGSSTTATTNEFANVEMPSLVVMAHNPMPYVSNITVGNLFVDYSPFVFSPVWGYKGASVEGDWDRMNYHVFALKHVQNSFTAGGRTYVFWPRWKLTAMGVYWEQNARQLSASTGSGSSLTPASGGTVNLTRVAQDLVYNLVANGKYWDNRLRLEGVYGRNEYVQSSTADFTDPFNPIFSSTLQPAQRANGEMWRGKIETDSLLIPGMGLSYSYRDVGTAYKPHYRQVPLYFDDTDSDQWGHNARVSWRRGGWIASAELDRMRRHSHRSSYRNKYLWGAGYYGYKGVDVALNGDWRREIYKDYDSDRSTFKAGKNEKVMGTELYVRSQFSPRMAGWIRPRQERIWHPEGNRNYTADSLHMRLEYYIASNARLFAEHKTSRFSDKASEPIGYPFDDNFTRVSFEVSF